MKHTRLAQYNGNVIVCIDDNFVPAIVMKRCDRLMHEEVKIVFGIETAPTYEL